MYCVIQLGSSSRLTQLPGAASADDTIEPLHSMKHMCATPLAQPTYLTGALPPLCMVHGVHDSTACCLSAEVVPLLASWPSTGEEIEAPETAQTGNVGHLTTPYNTMHSACVYWHIRGDPPPCSERELCVTITCEKDKAI